MKILHVFPFFTIKHGGGTCDLLYKIAYAQNEAGHDVTIWTGDYNFDSELADSLKGCNVRVFKSLMNFGFYVMPNLILTAKREIDQFDVIHLHLYRSFQNLVITHYANKLNVPFVIDAHGSVDLFVRKRMLKKLFDVIIGRRLLRKASCLVAETADGVAQYLNIGMPNKKITILSPPFSVEEFKVLPPAGSFRKKYDILDNPIVMFLGRIHHIKGLDLLLDGFHVFQRDNPDARLLIVGSDDGYENELKTRIKEYQLEDSVIFTGFIFGNEKLEALVDADVVVQTSRYEEGAWAPFEAVLCGTPIIVSDNSGAGRDVKKINAGYLCKFGDKRDLSDKIQYVLDNTQAAKDKTLKAKTFIEQNLSMKSRVGEYIDMYNGKWS